MFIHDVRQCVPAIGDEVFDGPSQVYVTVMEFGDGGETLRVDAKPDPTGDGAFPDGWRNWREVGDHLRGNFNY